MFLNFVFVFWKGPLICFVDIFLAKVIFKFVYPFTVNCYCTGVDIIALNSCKFMFCTFTFHFLLLVKWSYREHVSLYLSYLYLLILLLLSFYNLNLISVCVWFEVGPFVDDG